MHPGNSHPLESFRPNGPASFRAALARWLLLAAVAVAMGAPVHAAPSLENFERATLRLYGRPLEIYCHRLAGAATKRFLVLYSTGDGGWKGLDRELLTRIAAWGYPVGGFDSGRYLKDLGYADNPTTPERMSRDFTEIIAFTRQSLGLPPETPAVLVGWSRGAGLSVVAAGQPGTQRMLAGVIGVALTEAEENVVHHKVRKAGAPDALPAGNWWNLTPMSTFRVWGRCPWRYSSRRTTATCRRQTPAAGSVRTRPAGDCSPSSHPATTSGAAGTSCTCGFANRWPGWTSCGRGLALPDGGAGSLRADGTIALRWFC